MKDIAITFSAPMLVALRDGWKTVTRRAATSQLAKAVPGQRLWVRESFKGGVGRRIDLPGVADADRQAQRAHDLQARAHETEHVVAEESGATAEAAAG